jgi:2-polyprenyl-6-methoxyphenol hydroxylase-like FAD-dependent oxidoreductase
MAIVATVATERPHQETAWQRFLSTDTSSVRPGASELRAAY